MQLRGFALLSLLSGCGAAVVPPGQGNTGSDGSEGSGGVDDSTSAMTASAGSSGEGPGTSTTTGEASTTSSGGETSPGVDTCAFLCDDPTGWAECDLYAQDCPNGEKCAPYANDGGNAWNAWRCVPLDPDPAGPGEPCTREGASASGMDDCGVGSICWDVDPETGIGACQPHCIGSENAPGCEDPERHCTMGGDGILTLCLSECDPLDPLACPDGQGCYASYNGFACVVDASGDLGAFLEPCEYINGCDPGLMCHGEVASCEGSGCCVPACDLTAPDCPEPLSCAPFYGPGEGLPGLEYIGICQDAR